MAHRGKYFANQSFGGGGHFRFDPEVRVLRVSQALYVAEAGIGKGDSRGLGDVIAPLGVNEGRQVASEVGNRRHAVAAAGDAR